MIYTIFTVKFPRHGGRGVTMNSGKKLRVGLLKSFFLFRILLVHQKRETLCPKNTWGDYAAAFTFAAAVYLTFLRILFRRRQRKAYHRLWHNPLCLMYTHD